MQDSHRNSHDEFTSQCFGPKSLGFRPCQTWVLGLADCWITQVFRFTKTEVGNPTRRCTTACLCPIYSLQSSSTKI